MLATLFGVTTDASEVVTAVIAGTYLFKYPREAAVAAFWGTGVTVLLFLATAAMLEAHA